MQIEVILGSSGFEAEQQEKSPKQSLDEQSSPNYDGLAQTPVTCVPAFVYD